MKFVTMPEAQYIREHKRLIKELHNPSKKKLRKEAELQTKEIKKYIKKTYGATF
jgi:ribonuclease I